MFTLFNVRAASTRNKVNTATSTEDLAQAKEALSHAAANLATRIRRIPRRAYHPRDPEERAAVKAQWEATRKPELDRAANEIRKRMTTLHEALASLDSQREHRYTVGADGKVYPRHPDENRDARIVELRKRDLTIREIAAELGCSIATVHRIIKAAESTPTEQD